MASSSDLNSVILIGRLTRDAELTYTKTGTAVCNISIAVNTSRRENDQWISEANFFDVTYFGKPAEAVKQFLTKGKQIAVQGSLRQDSWDDKETGQRRSRVRIIANSIELLGGRSDSNGAPQSYGNGASGGYQARPSYSPAAPQSSAPAYDPAVEGDSFGGSASGFPEDIPF